MSQQISERGLMLLGNITGDEKIPVGVPGDLALTPDLLGSFLGGVFSGSYWPLGGAAQLTNDVEIDGNGNELHFSDIGLLQIDAQSFDLAAATSVNIAAITEILLTVGDNSFSVDPTIFSSVFASGNFLSFTDEVGLDVFVDDGVDSSSLSLGPAVFSLQMLGPDGIANISSDDFVNDTAYLGVNKVPASSTNTSSIGFIDSGGEYVDLHFGIHLGSTLEAVFYDTRTVRAGIEYHEWDSDDWTDDTLTTRGYVDSVVGGSGGVILGLASYTVAGVPSASPAGRLIYVSNEAGGGVPAFADGTVWRRITDGNPIEA